MPLDEETPSVGLLLDQKDFPPLGVQAGEKPIDKLRPGSDLHNHVRDYLVQRIRDSELEMQNFYSRWEAMELRIQAYINLEDWEQVIKTANDDGAPPKVISIVLPYTFAVVNTIVTFLLHTFTGRKPHFQVSSWKEEAAEGARNMEIVLQYNADHTRYIKWLWQFLQDTQAYGLGILRSGWQVTKAMRTIRTQQPKFSLFGIGLGQGEFQQQRVEKTVYEGNEISSHDPYLFFPDPRVPMTEVNKKGEFVVFRSYEARHLLKKLEAEGKVRWIDAAGEGRTSQDTDTHSVRSLMSGGKSTPGADQRTGVRLKRSVQVDQGTYWIIPKELGLGPGLIPELWQFSIANKHQIIQAEPFPNDHGMHPCVVAEPYSMGYGFGHLSISDYLGPLQDTMSWMVNSHMDNVRRVLNDVLVLDPSRIEMQDLKELGAGARIRLKKAAFGTDVKEAIFQLQILDVTQGHMTDLEIFLKIGQLLSAVSENFLGAQSSGDRKTATEIRTSAEAGASRLTAQARIISAQALVDLTEQMSLNVQQFLSDEFFLAVVGKDGIEHPIRLTPDHLSGDFHYPIHDGTLPLDRVALLDVWREVFVAMQNDPELRSMYSIPKTFEFIADLGGAKNIQGMKRTPEEQMQQQMQMQLQVQPDAQVQAGAQSGNLVPIKPPRIDHGTGSPGRRAAGGIQ